MKKSLLLLLATMSFSALSATTGTLLLTGIVPKKVEITVSPKPAASVLDLETTASNLSVGTLTGKANVLAGYKIAVSSSNLGKLVHTTTSSQFVNYTLKVDNTSVNLVTGQTLSYSGMGNYTKDLNISYTGIDGFNYESGNYNDTLTFTISSN